MRGVIRQFIRFICWFIQRCVECAVRFKPGRIFFINDVAMLIMIKNRGVIFAVGDLFDLIVVVIDVTECFALWISNIFDESIISKCVARLEIISIGEGGLMITIDKILGVIV